MSRVKRLGLVGTFAACVIPQLAYAAQAPTDPAKLLEEPVSIAIKLNYGRNPLQFGELRLPSGKGPFPLVIMIHGGCWERRLSSQAPEALTSFHLLSPAASSLTEHGYATWNIEYRRVGDDGGGWPNTFLDVGAATDFVRSIAQERHLDLNHVILLGHSSGGQLALWDAVRFKLPASSPLHSKHPLRIQDAISIDGPADLATFWPLQQQMCGAPVVTELMAGSPVEQPSRYAQAAVTGLMPNQVPQLLIERKEPASLLSIAQQYAAEATGRGDDVTLDLQKGPSHFDSINPQTEDWEIVIATIQAWLNPTR